MGSSPSHVEQRQVTHEGHDYNGQVKVIPHIIFEGMGRWTAPGGFVYVGEFADGKAHGFGKGTWPGGRTLEGKWVEGKPKGQCRFEIIEGRWRTIVGEFDGLHLKSKGCLVGDGEIYRGDTKENVPHGQGRLQKPNGEFLYIGEWANGTFHGCGKIYENGKLVYSGGFHHGLRHGKGKFWEGKTCIGEGTWEHGEKVEDVDPSLATEPSAPPFELLEEDEGKRNPLECPICMDNARNHLFKPCNHLATCEDCSTLIHTCPFCKAVKTSSIQIYIP